MVYLITLLCFEVCGILSSWNISASSRAHTKKKRYMCPQLACCPLNTHPGPTVIHTLQPSRVLSTLLRVTLSFLRSGSPSLSLCFILLLVFTPVVILVPSPFLSSSQGLLATLQQHQAPDIEMSRPSVSQTDIEKGEKDIKDIAEREGQITKADGG